MRERLGLPEGTTAMTPAELMKAILQAPVDLLWNGGIGTYVKASSEDHASVGDKANDPIRVDGRDLRVKVVGEGGNLGLTQLGRIQAALRGVRVNTDAIDNSAGVDCSDHEVNIKILLDQVVADGDLTTKQRNTLLAEMTDEVGRLVLRDNYEQNVLLGNARKQSHSMVTVHARLIKALESTGELDRALEFLPTQRAIERRDAEGQGLTSPEFSVLVAYSKIALSADVLASPIPDEPWFQQVLTRYFPKPLVERYADRLGAHPLRREIITTWVANDMVNRGGITFCFRTCEETGADPAQAVRAYVVAREVYGLEEYVARVEALDNVVSTTTQTDLYLEFRRLIDRAARWLVQNRPGDLDVQAEIDRFAPVVQRWRGSMEDLLLGPDLERMLRGRRPDGVRRRRPRDRAAGRRPARRVLAARPGRARRRRRRAGGAGRAAVLRRQRPVPPRRDARPDLPARARATGGRRWPAARCATTSTPPGWGCPARCSTAPTRAQDVEARIEVWERANASQLARARTTMDEVGQLEDGDLAAMSVALRVLRGVIRSGSAG